MMATFDAVLAAQIEREANQARREFTPASMKPRHMRGRSEKRVLRNGKWVRVDADAIATRQVVFGACKSRFDLRADMQEALETARLALAKLAA